MCRSNLAPNCIVPLQIAQVQVSAKHPDVSGMESKAITRQQLCLCVCLKKLPAITPPSSGPPVAIIAAKGSAMTLIMLSQLLWPRPEGEIMAPDYGGEGTTPEHEPPASVAQSRSNAGEVSKMQRQIAEFEARLAAKESKVADNL